MFVEQYILSGMCRSVVIQPISPKGKDIFQYSEKYKNYSPPQKSDHPILF